MAQRVELVCIDWLWPKESNWFALTDYSPKSELVCIDWLWPKEWTGLSWLLTDYFPKSELVCVDWLWPKDWTGLHWLIMAQRVELVCIDWLWPKEWNWFPQVGFHSHTHTKGQMRNDLSNPHPKSLDARKMSPSEFLQWASSSTLQGESLIHIVGRSSYAERHYWIQPSEVTWQQCRVFFGYYPINPLHPSSSYGPASLTSLP